MTLKNLILRLLFSLPFIAAVFYLKSYHGELINNAEVQWQYLQNSKGKIFLGLDVYAPSGITIQEISSHPWDVTQSWKLVNYPDWFKGDENFERFPVFKQLVHPYLSTLYHENVLLTSGLDPGKGWYTFLYEWNPADSRSLPPEDSLRIRYKNAGTQNIYDAEKISAPRILSAGGELRDKKPSLKFEVLYPMSHAARQPGENTEVVLNNLLPDDADAFQLKDLNRHGYSVVLRNKDGVVLDTLEGFVMWDTHAVGQVFMKRQASDDVGENTGGTDFTVLGRHATLVIFIIYFVIIHWFIGARFARWRGIDLDGEASKIVLPVFLGLVVSTYLFFVLGFIQGLTFPIIFGVLLVIYLTGFMEEPFFLVKRIIGLELRKALQQPWRVIFLLLLGWGLYQNFVYCFLPSTYADGSGDIENSYLPNLDYYMITHSFKVPIQNSTTGIHSQTFDVLRTIVKILAGEAGVYLLSFVYLALALGSMYLIAKKIFRTKNLLIYISVLLLLSANLFTELIHFGKIHIAALAFLLAALLCMSSEDLKKNYILPAVFLGVIASQYVYFLGLGVAYFVMIGVHAFVQHKEFRPRVLKPLSGAFLLFLILSAVFNLKLIMEVGTFVPPGISPEWMSDFFLKMNSENPRYHFIDNNYIRHFYKYHGLANFGQAMTLSTLMDKVIQTTKNLNFYVLLLFLPLLKKFDVSKMYYMIMSAVLVLLFVTIFPNAPRLSMFYYYPVIIIQWAIIDSLIFRVEKIVPIKSLDVKSRMIYAVVGLVLCVVIFDAPGSRIEIRRAAFLNTMRNPLHVEGLFNEAQSVFWGRESAYDYLQKIQTDPEMFPGTRFGAHRNFDYAMLIRQYTRVDDMILTVPVRFHSHAMRPLTARHALGSVLYQLDVKKIMDDLKKLNIRYLSVMPIHYRDYNPFYTPVFEDQIFFKYFKPLFSYNGTTFYKIIYDGSHEEYTSTPYNVKGYPFVPMMAERR
ncbi:MAG TPA: hypothetical protein DD723_03335 [Candidatus Omnitrophica bacterium]|nr:MAG: hypothetical protein A2Z81_00940 [Omnitrophica WOR_2 bacterium GWA2_45_18]HBR14563.1 hypothetical protein [Candidatus Omnitrophota bacterium]